MKKSGKIKKRIIAAGVLFLLVFFCFFAVNDMMQKIREQKIDAIRENILSTAVQCYTVEGVFPPNLAYMEEQYGLVVDKDAYIITYDAFSSNVLPDVRVLVRGKG